MKSFLSVSLAIICIACMAVPSFADGIYFDDDFTVNGLEQVGIEPFVVDSSRVMYIPKFYNMMVSLNSKVNAFFVSNSSLPRNIAYFIPAANSSPPSYPSIMYVVVYSSTLVVGRSVYFLKADINTNGICTNVNFLVSGAYSVTSFTSSRIESSQSTKSCNFNISQFIDDWSTETFPGLQVSIITNSPIVEKLQALVTHAKSLDRGEWTASSWNTLQSSIVSAEKYVMTLSYKTEVALLLGQLQTAIDSLELPPNADELVSLISQANQLKQADWTAASWEALQSAIAYAEQIVESRIGASEIEAARQQLQFVLDSLEPIPPPPIPPPEFSGGIPADSVEAFPSAILAWILLILPVSIALFSILFGLRLIPRIFRRFSKS